MIPAFDHNLVLPPHLGDPRLPEHISPYTCHTTELCDRFGFSVERQKILEGFLNFRDRIRAGGITNGYQWVDGSFVEHVEARDSKSPSDIDVVTVYWGYPLPVQVELIKVFPEFSNPASGKAKLLCGSLSLRRRLLSGKYLGLDSLLVLTFLPQQEKNLEGYAED